MAFMLKKRAAMKNSEEKDEELELSSIFVFFFFLSFQDKGVVSLFCKLFCTVKQKYFLINQKHFLKQLKTFLKRITNVFCKKNNLNASRTQKYFPKSDFGNFKILPKEPKRLPKHFAYIFCSNVKSTYSKTACADRFVNVRSFPTTRKQLPEGHVPKRGYIFPKIGFSNFKILPKELKSVSDYGCIVEETLQSTLLKSFAYVKSTYSKTACADCFVNVRSFPTTGKQLPEGHMPKRGLIRSDLVLR